MSLFNYIILMVDSVLFEGVGVASLLVLSGQNHCHSLKHQLQLCLEKSEYTFTLCIIIIILPRSIFLISLV